MLDPATARLCVWRLPLEAAFRLFSKLGSLGGSIRERFSRTGRTRPALARPAFSRWLLENDRLRERWPCQWLNVLYFPFSETSPHGTGHRCTRLFRCHEVGPPPRVALRNTGPSRWNCGAGGSRYVRQRSGLPRPGPAPRPGSTNGGHSPRGMIRYTTAGSEGACPTAFVMGVQPTPLGARR